MLFHILCSFSRGVSGVYYNKEGLPGLLHIRNGFLLRFQVIPPWNIRDGSVGGHHKADGAMLLHNFFGTQFRRLGHGDLIVIPGGSHHSGSSLFLRPHRSGHHIAYRVNHPDLELCFPVRRYFRRLLRDELGFRGHDGFPGAALGQFIPCPFFSVGIFNGRNHQLLHNPLNQSGFSRPHRANHTDINIPSGTAGNVLINVRHSASSFMRQEKAPAMGLLKGMSPMMGLEPRAYHKMLCFFLEN